VNPRFSAKSSLSDACELITDGTHFSPASFDSGEFMYLTSKNVRDDLI
jgi:type I restriction enzyme S subunit